jgi:hypothetical protein
VIAELVIPTTILGTPGHIITSEINALKEDTENHNDFDSPEMCCGL